MTITNSTCPCCEDLTFHVEIDKEAVTFDGETMQLHMTHDELQAFYFELKEELLHGDYELPVEEDEEEEDEWDITLSAAMKQSEETGESFHHIMGRLLGGID